MTDTRDIRVGVPIVQSGNYEIPKHLHWVEVQGGYLVDYSDAIESSLEAERKRIEDELAKYTAKHDQFWVEEVRAILQEEPGDE